MQSRTAALGMHPAWNHDRLLHLTRNACVLLALMTGLACSIQPGPPAIRKEPAQVPRFTIRPSRTAVFVPQTNDPMLEYAYARLETHIDLVLRQALGSRVVERRQLGPIQAEQRWQYTEGAAESTAARLGRLFGADTLVLFRIIVPTIRERLFAGDGNSPTPVVIIGRVVSVETGEVVWDHLVSTDVRPTGDWRGISIRYDPAVRQALDLGITQMETALDTAVHCGPPDCLP